jgi:hypothetical protein
MRVWYRFLPLLVVVMLLVQFEPTITARSVVAPPSALGESGSAAPLDSPTGFEQPTSQGPHSDLANVNSTSPQSQASNGSQSPASLPTLGLGESTQSIASSSAPIGPNQNRAQSGEIPAKVSVDISPSNNSLLVIPTVVDESAWPTVEVSVYNPNAFWVAIQVQSTSDADVSEFVYPWAQFHVIPPGEEAIYNLQFSEVDDSSIQFYIDASALDMPQTDQPGGDLDRLGGGFYTFADFVFTNVTAGFVPLDRLLLLMMPSSVDAPSLAEDLVRELFGTVACSNLINSTSSGGFPGSGIWSWVQDAYRCFTSPEMMTFVSEILAEAGEDTTQLKAFGPLLTVADAYAALFVSSYQLFSSGTYSATITFESIVSEYGRVRVHQVDEDGNPVPGGCYTLRSTTDPSSQRLGSGCDERDGNLDGSITIGSKPGDMAILGNTSAPDGYAAPSDRSVELVQNQTVDITVDLVRGTAVTVSVVDDDGEPVRGACFALTPALLAGDLEECDQSDGSEDGTITFDNVGAGQYMLNQTVVPFNHSGAEDQQITVEQDLPQSITVINSFDGFGSLVINLSAEDGSLPLGSCFDVFKIDESPNQFVARLCDDSSGVLELDPIRYGGYQLVQVTTPDGYLPAPDTEFAIMGGAGDCSGCHKPWSRESADS